MTVSLFNFALFRGPTVDFHSHERQIEEESNVDRIYNQHKTYQLTHWDNSSIFPDFLEST